MLIHWFPVFQYILVSLFSLRVFLFQQTERMNLFIYSQKNWAFWVYKKNWLAFFIINKVFLCVTIHVYQMFFFIGLHAELR